MKGGFDMFSSRKYFLNEIALFANSDETLYRNVFKPIIDNGKLWGNYEVWETAAQVAIINYIKVNFPMESEQANAMAEKFFSENDLTELANSFMDYYEKEMTELKTKSIKEYKAKMKEIFGE